MLKQEILAAIEYYYPEGIDETYENEKYHQSNQIVRHHEALRVAGERYDLEWGDFLEAVSGMKISYLDFTHLPSINSKKKFYNTCFSAHFNLNDYVIIVVVSGLFKCYNLLVVNISGPKQADFFAVRDNFPEEVSLRYQLVSELLKTRYYDYVELPYEIMAMRVPGFSVQPFEQGEARVFHYLYTLLTLYDDALWF